MTLVVQVIGIQSWARQTALELAQACVMAAMAYSTEYCFGYFG